MAHILQNQRSCRVIILCTTLTINKHNRGSIIQVSVKDGDEEGVDEEEEIRLADEKKLKILMGGMKEIKGNLS